MSQNTFKEIIPIFLICRGQGICLNMFGKSGQLKWIFYGKPEIKCSYLFKKYSRIKQSLKVSMHVVFQVTIEHLDLDADCSIDFLILYNGDTQMKPHLTQPLCGNQAPSPIITQTNLMLVEFHSGASTKPRTGFKLSLEEETTGRCIPY